MKSTWRNTFDEMQDPYFRASLLKAIAEVGTDQEMNDIMDRLDLNYPGLNTGILWTISLRDQASLSTRQRAQKMYGEIMQ